MAFPILSFCYQEFEHRIDITRRETEARGLLLLIISDRSNMNWLTGYDGWSFYVHQCVILGPIGDPIWFGREQDGAGAQRTVFMQDVNIIGYPGHYSRSIERHLMQYLAAQIKSLALYAKSIRVEMDNYWFSAAAYEALHKDLPNSTLQRCTSLVRWQRVVKSLAELAYMRQAGRIVGRMLERAQVWPRKCVLVADIYNAALRFDPEIGSSGDYPALVPLLP